MRLSDKSTKDLQALLKDLFGLELSDEQAQEAGLAIMRFVAAKAQREEQLIKRKDDHHVALPRNN